MRTQHFSSGQQQTLPLGAERMRGRSESGLALLLVLVMAAAIAMALYIEIPRVAFESQRSREQLFLDRGLAYKRAVQLFYRKYRTYPQTLDDLQTARNIRFLRQRYADPLTGQDYRLIHVGPGGILTDSVNQPANSLLPGNNAGSNVAGASTTPPALGPDGQPVAPVDRINMAVRRPSDRIAPTGGALPESDQNLEPSPDQLAQAGQPPDPGQPGFPSQAPQPGDQQDPAQTPTNTGQRAQPTPYSGQLGAPGMQTNPIQLNPSQTPAPATQAVGDTPQQTLPQQSQAANPIPNQTPAPVMGFFGGIAGGIVGVASYAEGTGIHVVNDHTRYKEWELIYDVRKDRTALGGLMFPQLPLQTNGAPGMNTPQSRTTGSK
jgi:hypothetical protein